MNDMKIFNNPDFGDIRTVERDGEPWFVGKDIARALGYSNPSKAIHTHVGTEDKKFEMMPVSDSRNGNLVTVSDSQNGNLVKTALINESGVYSLIFSSKMEAAQKFKHWVTSEVLPSLRKTGAYLTPAAEEKLLTALEALTARVEALEGAANCFPMGNIPALPAPLPQAFVNQEPPGRDFLRRWMRTASEKLTLLSNKYNMGSNAILHKLYGYLEEDFSIVLEDERLRIMEEQGLDDCSTLKAIFYDSDFRERLEDLIDYNLAPENRGW